MARLAYTQHILVLISISLVSTFAVVLLPMAHLARIQYKIVLFSLAQQLLLSYLRLGFDESQYVLRYIVLNTIIANKHFIIAFLLRFSVAVATYISLASHSTCLPHSHSDVGPSRAGLTLHVSFVNVNALGLCYQSSGPTYFCPKMAIQAVKGLSKVLFLFKAYLTSRARLLQNWNGFHIGPTHYDVCKPNLTRIFSSNLSFSLFYYCNQLGFLTTT